MCPTLMFVFAQPSEHCCNWFYTPKDMHGLYINLHIKGHRPVADCITWDH